MTDRQTDRRVVMVGDSEVEEHPAKETGNDLAGKQEQDQLNSFKHIVFQEGERREG